MVETAKEIQTARVMVASTAKGRTSQRDGKNPKDVQRNAVGHRLEKWAASAVGMKTKTFVENETRKDE
jgi:hypothetical protein